MSVAVLLSGGIDSTALTFWRQVDVALTIDYGQRPAEGEIRAARQIARERGIPHEVLTVDCRGLGSGDLAGAEMASVAPMQEWWPFRNQLLVTVAAMRCIALGVGEIVCGSVASDGHHRDGTRAFYDHVDALTLMQEGGIRIAAPAIDMTSVELVRAAGVAPEILAWTHSCHTANFACGSCRGCYKHEGVLDELGL